MPIFTDSGIQMAFLLVQSGARLMSLDRSRTIRHNSKHHNRTFSSQENMQDMEELATHDHHSEEPVEIDGDDVPTYRSKEATSARIRWLVERRFSPSDGRIRSFSEATGISDSKVKNLIYGLNTPNSDDLEIICDFFEVQPAFVLWGRLDNMPWDFVREVRGNARLRELLEKKDVPLPDYLTGA